jgi:hypothetical protein
MAPNGGGDSVSSFGVGKDGRLRLLDVKPTENTFKGRSDTAKSLAYSPSKGMLFVVHSFGPGHVRLMSVDGSVEQLPLRSTLSFHRTRTPARAHQNRRDGHTFA